LRALPQAGRSSLENSNQTAERKSKLHAIEGCVAEFVADRCESLWVGGMHMHNVPMALVRECIRQGKRFETFYAGPSSSLAADLLIGSGSVDRVIVGYIGFEHIGPAPAFRRAAADPQSKVEFVEADSGSMLLALQAGASGQPFAALPPGLEMTDLAAASPSYYVGVVDPFTGEERLAVKAITPAVALLHCQQSDEFGNGIFKGSQFSDRLAAMAAGAVLLQVEGEVGTNQLLKNPQQTGVPSMLVSAVAQVNFGCHPTSSHRYYNFDDVHLRLYLEAASTEEGFQEYLRTYVTEPKDQDEYMRRVQNQDWSSIGR
jgi:glutaconate CoA-transferase, subunit A